MTTRKDIVQEYNKQFKFIRDLFIKNDIVGLIAGGAPNDEYDSEINKLMLEIKNCKSEKEMQKLIFDIFSGVGSVDLRKCKNNANVLWNYFSK